MLRPMTALSFAFLALPALAAPPAAADVARVKRVTAADHQDGAQVRIEMSAAPIFTTRGQQSPPKLFVSLPGAAAKATTLSAPHPWIHAVAVRSEAGATGPLTQVEVQLHKAHTYNVHAEGKTLVVTFNALDEDATQTNVPARAWSEKALKSAAVHPPPKAVKLASLSSTDRSVRADFGGTHRGIRLAQDEGAAGAGTDEESFDDEAEDGATGDVAMTYVGFRDNSSVSQVFARMNQRNAKYSVKREGDNMLVLEIENASIPLRNNRNHLDATYFESPVKMVTPTEVTSATPKIRIVIEMNNNVPYEDTRDGVDIVLSFRK